MVMDLHADSVQRAGPADPFCVGPEATEFEVLKELKSRGRGEALVCRQGVLVVFLPKRSTTCHRFPNPASKSETAREGPVAAHVALVNHHGSIRNGQCCVDQGT
jgi:hypothetical protein